MFRRHSTMTLDQYNSLMSSLLKERHSLAKLREELEGRKEKLYRRCKGFRHLAHNYKNEREGKKGTITPQNKFEILRSRVMQCRVEEQVVRRQESVVVKCFKCEEEGHKYKECLLWERVACTVKPQKVYQQKKPACPVKGEVQEKGLRRVEEEKAVHVVKP